jgi:hypothetical protein
MQALWAQVFAGTLLSLAQILREPLMRLWDIEEFWIGLGCAALVFCIGSFFAVMVYGCIFGDLAKHMARVEANRGR